MAEFPHAYEEGKVRASWLLWGCVWSRLCPVWEAGGQRGAPARQPSPRVTQSWPQGAAGSGSYLGQNE